MSNEQRTIYSINPFNGKTIALYKEITQKELANKLEQSSTAWESWKKTRFDQRAALMYKAAKVLRDEKVQLAELITSEMGKLIGESEAEIEKCAWVCEYYAENAKNMLADEPIATEAQHSMAVFEPIGAILAIMPWNYPFWQTFRFAAPAIMAGNVALLKHASNVQGCALAIESIFIKAGFPSSVFTTLVIGAPMVEQAIAHSAVCAVTLTGSEGAGSEVAALAGKYLKKTVLELGGSDPFIVLDDADLDKAARTGLTSRMLTSGQTCIAAKRFIVSQTIADEFVEKLLALIENYRLGDPLLPETTLAPLAKRIFATEVHQQETDSIKLGANCLTGGQLPDDGCFYPPTLIICPDVKVPVFEEETFGPIIALTIVNNTQQAINIANNTRFGLGASVWTNNRDLAMQMVRQIEAGAVFVNQLVKSDPRMPFGGIKKSGYGRELSHYGIKEFCNIKSIWIE